MGFRIRSLRHRAGQHDEKDALNFFCAGRVQRRYALASRFMGVRSRPRDPTPSHRRHPCHGDAQVRQSAGAGDRDRPRLFRLAAIDGADRDDARAKRLCGGHLRLLRAWPKSDAHARRTRQTRNEHGGAPQRHRRGRALRAASALGRWAGRARRPFDGHGSRRASRDPRSADRRGRRVFLLRRGRHARPAEKSHHHRRRMGVATADRGRRARRFASSRRRRRRRASPMATSRVEPGAGWRSRGASNISAFSTVATR